MPLTHNDIVSLINEKRETPNLDYKLDLVWSRENRGQTLGIIKDILAMANTKDGGRIVFGVRDDDFEKVGISGASWEKFDVTSINDLLENYADPTFTCNLYKKILDEKRFVVIDVPEFQEIPIVCKNNAEDNSNKLILRKGAVYIRTTKCTSEEVSSADQMRSILGTGLIKKSDEMLNSIHKLIIGKPLIPDKSTKAIYADEINQAEKYLSTMLSEDYGYFKLITYPSNYEKNRIENHSMVGSILNDTKVLLRGWTFPHLDTRNATNFDKGKQSYTKWENESEVWQLFFSGLFIWKGLFWEDITGKVANDGKKMLDFINIIYQITEMMLFCKRLYGEKLSVDSIHLKLVLGRCNNRKLRSSQFTADIYGFTSGVEDILIEKDIKVIDLQSSFEMVAKDLIKKIFILFNWDDPNESMIESWQRKLIEKGGI